MRLGYGCFFAPSELMLSFEQHAVLWELVCLFTRHSKPFSQENKTSNKNGLYTGQVRWCYWIYFCKKLGSLSRQAFRELIVNGFYIGIRLILSYGSFSIVEAVTDKFLYWFPFYYHAKFAFLVWLQFPSADGSRQLYVRYLRPFLRKHQARFDQIVGFLQTETANFANAYKAEFQLARSLLLKIFSSGRDIVHPGGGIHGAIEGPTGEDEDLESEDKDD